MTANPTQLQNNCSVIYWLKCLLQDISTNRHTPYHSAILWQYGEIMTLQLKDNIADMDHSLNLKVQYTTNHTPSWHNVSDKYVMRQIHIN
jgi:hypothetical protein